MQQIAAFNTRLADSDTKVARTETIVNNALQATDAVAESTIFPNQTRFFAEGSHKMADESSSSESGTFAWASGPNAPRSYRDQAPTPHPAFTSQ